MTTADCAPVRTNPMGRVETEKYRIRRRFFDARSGQFYASIREIPRTLEPNPQAITAILKIGYVPGHATLFRDVDCLPGGCAIGAANGTWNVESRFRFADVVSRAAYRGQSTAALLRRTVSEFREAVGRAFETGEEPLVPLSGGLDSRSILACLLECTEASRIHTYTYGIPGSTDFDIGNAVAAAAGTRHTTIDMRDVPFSHEGLLETARLCDGNTTILHPFVWIEVIRRFGKQQRLWSGYTGDGVGGSHYLPPTRSLRPAEDYVLHEAQLYHFFTADAGLDETLGLVPDWNKYEDVLSAEEAVWFENHVERYTAHQIFMAGLGYATPFMDDGFVSHFFSLPEHFRRGKHFFNESMLALNSRLFQVPTVDYGYRLAGSRAKHAGWVAKQTAKKIGYRLLPQWSVHPGTTYIDFAVGFRRRADTRVIARSALDSLIRRDLLPRRRIEQLWKALDAGGSGRRFINTVLALVSLELTLQAFSGAGPR